MLNLHCKLNAETEAMHSIKVTVADSATHVHSLVSLAMGIRTAAICRAVVGIR